LKSAACHGIRIRREKVDTHTHNVGLGSIDDESLLKRMHANQLSLLETNTSQNNQVF